MDSLVRSVATSPKLAVVLGARRLSVHRWIAVAFATLVLTGLWTTRASALVVTNETATTTLPPADNPGWNNVTVGANTKNFTYLGNGWALSAWHVGPFVGQGGTDLQLTFSTGTVSVIPNQIFTVKNPSGSGLSEFTDLNLVRLNAELPGITGATLPAYSANGLQDSIVGTAASNVTYIGNGRTRIDPQTTFNGHPGNWGGTDRTKRWGSNQIANENSVFSESDPDLRGTINVGTGANPRHVVSMVTQYNLGVSNEAQAVDGDSGSAVFRKNGTQWELIGIVNTVLLYDGQNTAGAFNGNYTTFADLSYYRTAIQTIMDSHTAFSIAGDVNLDGVLSGNGTGPASSDDITAFVQGWGTPAGAANVTSWKKGDLNLDGAVNSSDFFLMRNALATANMSFGADALSALLGQGVVPEPSSLAILAMGTFLAWGNRRSRRAS